MGNWRDIEKGTRGWREGIILLEGGGGTKPRGRGKAL